MTQLQRDKDLIRQAMNYRAPQNLPAPPHMGSMQVAQLFQTLGMRYGTMGFSDALDKADRPTVDTLLRLCASVIQTMTAQPTKPCACCGAIIQDANAGTTKEADAD